MNLVRLTRLYLWSAALALPTARCDGETGRIVHQPRQCCLNRYGFLKSSSDVYFTYLLRIHMFRPYMVGFIV